MTYLLASNCFVTPGTSRSLLVDLQRFRQYLLSNEFCALLSQRIISKAAIPAKYEEVFQFLIQEDIVLTIDEDDIKLFSELNTTFETPSFINDAIIDVNDRLHDFKKIFSELYTLLCRHIEIRFFNKVELDTIKSIFHEIRGSTIEAIDIYLPYSSYLTYQMDIDNLIEENIQFRVLYVHSCSENLTINKRGRILFSSQKMNSELHCGVISKFFFHINSLTYFESLRYNTCLNRKISINAAGEIKNCPSMTKSYGNICTTSLHEAIDTEGFKDLWYIHKDQIQVCKDCEFRHICTDCRAYIEQPDNIYSKPLKCGYDPYTATWEEWSTHPLKQKAIEHYKL